MPDLRPFRALRYRASDDLSRLLCPPYDVISTAERGRLAALDAHNAVHLELPDSYEAAAQALADWLARGVLARDADAAIYPYAQRYATGDGASIARGFFCVLRLEPYGAGVRAHEATLGPAKEDRYRLLEAVRTNISPVLLVYDAGDGGRESGRLLDELTAEAPLARAGDAQTGHHALWMAGGDAAAAQELLQLAGARPLTIADGHHRYETALRYAQREALAHEAQYVLALLYDAHSGGLELRPWHRLLHGVDGAWLSGRLERFFEVQRRHEPEQLIADLGRADQGTFGFWTAGGGALLTVRRDAVAPLLPDAASATLRWLDVNVLSVTLSAMNEHSAGRAAANLTYDSDAQSAIAAVDAGDADVTFLLRPTPIEAVMDVSAAGEYMPPKSTYFGPKAATGLVFHALSE